MKSKNMRDNPFFMRNGFKTDGKLKFPLIKKQPIDVTNVNLIACANTKSRESEIRINCGVHFFVDDYRFEGIYTNPERTLDKYSQYSFLLTPDFSTYTDMDYWRQIESIGKNRWVGAFWQHYGLTVIPTVTWSDKNSFEFCFDGIEKGSIVAIGTIGCKKSKNAFLEGYFAMLDKLAPSTIPCVGTPFSEMKENIIAFDNNYGKEVIKHGRPW